jgi:Zn-dependent membrane protease YugP
MYWYFDEYYLLLVLPAIIIAMLAQWRVRSAYGRFSKVYTRRNITGAEAARRILEENGVHDVRIETVAGQLTDHYDPRTNVIRLSEGIYDSSSVSAIGIAAHDAGHAVQYATGYAPIRLRSAIIPITQIGSSLTTPLILIGFILSVPFLIDLGLIFFAAAIFFQLVTLPVEYNASARAVRALEGSGLFEYEEIDNARKVLNAAAMTYLAALAVSLAQFIRIFMLGRSRRR